MIDNYIIRMAKIDDLEPIIEIYNQAIDEKFCTADTRTLEPEDRKDWFVEHSSETYPIIVLEVDEEIAGWISISPYRAGREALRYTVEVSYYVDRDFRRMGIAENLLNKAIEESKRLGYKSIFTIILDKNLPSIMLMEKFCFERWALMPNIADFDGEECGHVYYGLRIN